MNISLFALSRDISDDAEFLIFSKAISISLIHSQVKRQTLRRVQLIREEQTSTSQNLPTSSSKSTQPTSTPQPCEKQSLFINSFSSIKADCCRTSNTGTPARVGANVRNSSCLTLCPLLDGRKPSHTGTISGLMMERPGHVRLFPARRRA